MCCASSFRRATRWQPARSARRRKPRWSSPAWRVSSLAPEIVDGNMHFHVKPARWGRYFAALVGVGMPLDAVADLEALAPLITRFAALLTAADRLLDAASILRPSTPADNGDWYFHAKPKMLLGAANDKLALRQFRQQVPGTWNPDDLQPPYDAVVELLLSAKSDATARDAGPRGTGS